ncbi:MAG: sulfatase-like hydrolase/transferase [Candidatus Nanohalobium sp.]
MSEFKNVFIFVSDALHHEYMPEKIIEESESGLIKCLAPSLHSPQSFASILTSLESYNHSIGGFFDNLEEDTYMGFFKDSVFYDHEYSNVANCLNIEPGTKELNEVEPPFFFIERALETHEPYGKMGHGNEIPDHDEPHGDEYYAKYTDDEIQEKYQDSVDKMEEHFWRHVQELKDRGLYEDTLIVITADHGETLGQRIYGRKRYGHNSPPSKDVGQVPLVFLNADPNVDHMRSVDIIPTAFSLMGKANLLEVDGINVTTEGAPDEGVCMTPMRLFKLKWEWNGEDWEPSNIFKTLFEDLVYKRPVRELYDKVNPH